MQGRAAGGSGTATTTHPTLPAGTMLTLAVAIIDTTAFDLTVSCMKAYLIALRENAHVDLVRAGAQPSGPRQRLSSGRCSGRNAQCAAHPPSKHFRIARSILYTFTTTLPYRYHESVLLNPPRLVHTLVPRTPSTNCGH
jgi:hypothetical protein